MRLVGRIETNELDMNEKYLEIGGLDTPFAKNAQGYSTTE
jgi:hypothetical protein